jgi:hypothetical protein
MTHAVFSLLITFRDFIGRFLKAQVMVSNPMNLDYKKMQLFPTAQQCPIGTQMG